MTIKNYQKMQRKQNKPNTVLKKESVSAQMLRSILSENQVAMDFLLKSLAVLDLEPKVECIIPNGIQTDIFISIQCDVSTQRHQLVLTTTKVCSEVLGDKVRVGIISCSEDCWQCLSMFSNGEYLEDDTRKMIDFIQSCQILSETLTA